MADQLAQLQQSIDGVKDAVTSEINRVNGVIAALQTKVDAGSSPDLTAQIAELQSIADNLNGAFNPTAPPTQSQPTQS